jgi:hypothetical protein
MTIFPNPVNPFTQALNLSLDYPADTTDVRLDIYTSGYRKVREISLGPVLSGKKVMAVPVDKLKELSRGTYYIKIISKDINGKDDKGRINRIIILY